MPLATPRVYPIVDATALEARQVDIVAAAEALLQGGARILQFRFKDQLTSRRLDQAETLGELCRQAGAIWVVNDRADVALLTGGGLHIGQTDLAPAVVRRVLGPEAVIGLSTHDEAQLRAASAEPVDYLAFGPVFETGSKQKPDPTVGVRALERLRTLTGRPLVAIGGITRESARQVWRAGADSVAVIGDLLPDPCTPPAIRERMREWAVLATML